MYLGSSSMPATGRSIDVQLIDIIRLGDDSFAPGARASRRIGGSGFPTQCRLTADGELRDSARQ